MAGRTEWSNGGNGGNGGRTEWSNGGNGRMAEMATYILFTVHTNDDTDTNNDDDTLIFYLDGIVNRMVKWWEWSNGGTDGMVEWR